MHVLVLTIRHLLIIASHRPATPDTLTLVLGSLSTEKAVVFHAPEEAARILGEAIDFARQRQLSILRSQ
jgi:hypothetical protein